MKKVLSVLLSVVILASMLVGCGTSGSELSDGSEASQQTNTSISEPSTVSETPQQENGTSNYPVTIENNGNTITYEAAPARVVALSYTTAEILTALGLENRVVMLAPCMNQIDEVMEEYRGTIAQMPVFDESGMTNGVPNLETVLAAEPDFVYGSVYSFFETNCGAAEDYLNNGIGIYASEKTYTKGAGLEELYTEILNIGKIFDVNETAQALVESLKARESAVAEAVAGLDSVSVFVFDYDEGQGTYNTTGGMNFLDSLITLAGGEGVFADQETSYVSVSAEEIVARDPQYVLTISYYTADDGQNKIEAFKTSDDFVGVQAVANDRFLSLGGLAIGASSGLQSLDGLEAIARFLHPEVFQE